MNLFKYKLTGWRIFLIVISYLIAIALWIVLPLVMLGISLTMAIWFVQKYHRILFANND